MTAQQFLQSKEPNVFIIPEEWLEEYANIVLNIAAEKAKIDMKKKSNYGKSRKWQERQIYYEDLAWKYIDNEHNYKKYTYKAMATRDCWKELAVYLESV